MSREHNDREQLRKRIKSHNAKVDAAFRAILDITPFDRSEHDYHLIESLARQVDQLSIDHNEIPIREWMNG